MIISIMGQGHLFLSSEIRYLACSDISEKQESQVQFNKIKQREGHKGTAVAILLPYTIHR